MKKTLNLIGGGMLLFTFLAYQGCKDPCKDVTCLNGGTCDEETGACVCLSGYEGTDCGTKWADSFTGTYKYNESSGTGCGGFTDWPVTITASSSDATKILISGFGAFECSGAAIVAEATVSSTTNLTVVSSQSFCSGALTISSGSGTMSGNVITVTYTYSQGSGSVTCTGTYTKQ